MFGSIDSNITWKDLQDDRPATEILSRLHLSSTWLVDWFGAMEKDAAQISIP